MSHRRGSTPTVVAKQPGGRERQGVTGRRRTTGGLPPDLLTDATRRLRLIALVYAGTFFVAAFLPSLLCFRCPGMPSMQNPQLTAGITSIALGIGVFGLTFVRSIELPKLLAVGLVFEVLGSYGIALSEYPGLSGGLAYREGVFGGFGLSWVSAWVLVFSIVVPTPPGRALLAAILAVAAVPSTFVLGIEHGWISIVVPPGPFFFSLVFPYLIVAALAWVSSRVVYGLGREVREARELGSYSLVERLGQGGMGEVWRARHRLLARPAAIKLVQPGRLGGDAKARSMALARFEREAQATAAMRCPHTIELYDFGMTDDGSFYYVMELLDGLDLETLVEEYGPLPAERAVYLLRQVCHSLGEAHERGLIHRDIKPANIFVCRHGRELDWVKVLDFGIVKIRGEGHRDEVKLTAEEGAGGTPAYMAPEQILGRSQPDGRTDIYALGCVIHWMLTGRLVFEGRTAMDAMMRHVQEQPAPPSTRTELPVPPALDRIVMSCLEKDPDRRPPTADAVDAELGAVPLDEPWSRDRASRWWTAHRPPAEGWDSIPAPGLATPSSRS